jgi:CBS domain-containing protein
MQLKDIMTGQVQVIEPGATLEECARKMRDGDFGAVPVCDGDRIVGIITDRDIAVRAVAEGEDPRTCRVADVMTGDITWCYDDQQVEEAANLMTEKQIRRLIVVDRTKKLCGIVALADLAVRGEEDARKADTLEGVSEPT